MSLLLMKGGLPIKVTVSYETLVRKNDKYKLKIKYSRSNPKFITGLFLEEVNGDNIIDLPYYKVLKFNIAMLFKSVKYGNKVLDDIINKYQ